MPAVEKRLGRGMGVTGSEHPLKSSGKTTETQTGAAKGAAHGSNPVAEAVLAIMALPLTADEKADAVRKLMGG